MPEQLEIDGVSVSYEDLGGDGPAVVFVHGLGGTAASWGAQLEAASEAGFRAIAYDQRGAGLSSKPPGPYSVELWAEDLERLLDALEIQTSALVGQSVGCMVAEHGAVRRGGRVWGLALLGGALRWRPESGPVFEERIRLAREGRMGEIAEMVAATGLSDRCRSENPALLRRFLELIASNDPQAYAESAAATAVAEMVHPERVACPVLAFCGEHDPVAPPAFAEAVADAVPKGELGVIEGAAHWCQIEAPERVNTVLLGFLDRIAT